MEKLRKSGERNSTVYIIFHRLERGERSEDLLQALSAEMPDIFALSADKPDQAPAGYPVRMQRTEKGAPSIEGRPDLYLSISHSGGWWVCAIAGIPVGIDLEFPRFRKDETEDSLAKRVKHLSARFFTQEEADYVAEGLLKSEKNADMGKITETEAGSDSACIRRFLTLWTAREAYVKCLGTGIRGDFSGQSVLPEESCQSQFPENGWTARDMYFRMQELGQSVQEGYRCCLCSAAAAEVVIRRF